MIDVAAFYQGLAREATNLGPDSSVSFEKDFTAPCKQMLSLAPYFNETPSPSTTPTATSPSRAARPECTCRAVGRR